MNYQATYSPDDNKLRLYASTRLDAETFQRVKAAGFRWAPKQELFVAPAWTPEREDLLIELAGEVEDDDTSLTARAEQRAERFEDYSEKREKDYQRASAAADEYAKPFANGQPILVGHHSEKRARKDQERCHNAMHRAIKAFETAEYWQHRAAGAIAAAKYKERPDVRARRIKKIEADLRKVEKNKANAERSIKEWSVEGMTLGQAKCVANFEHIYRRFPLADYPRAAPASQYEGDMGLWSALDGGVITAEQAQEIALRAHRGYLPHADRWIAHYNNRLAYERAMLAESGYIAPPKRVSRAVLPLLNYRAESVEVVEYGTKNVYQVIETTKAALAKVSTSYKGTRIVDGTHRVRIALGACLAVSGDMNARHRYYALFLTDAKQHPRPGTEPESDAAQEVQARINAAADKIDRNVAAAKKARAHNAALIERAPKQRRQEPAEVEAMRATRDAIASGSVPIIVADQLFPTPPDLAARMVALADIGPGERVLEPSAGTGNILRAIVDAETDRHRAGPAPHVTAVEINARLVGALPAHLAGRVLNSNFLEVTPDTVFTDGTLGTFDAIVMNPPFRNGEDIKHIEHAARFLKPDGRLVAICANGPRQQAKLAEWAESSGGTYEALPDGTFAAQGTQVGAALLTFRAPAVAQAVAA